MAWIEINSTVNSLYTPHVSATSASSGRSSSIITFRASEDYLPDYKIDTTFRVYFTYTHSVSPGCYFNVSLYCDGRVASTTIYMSSSAGRGSGYVEIPAGTVFENTNHESSICLSVYCHAPTQYESCTASVTVTSYSTSSVRMYANQLSPPENNKIATQKEVRSFGYTGGPYSSNLVSAGKCSTHSWLNDGPESNITVPIVSISYTIVNKRNFSIYLDYYDNTLWFCFGVVPLANAHDIISSYNIPAGNIRLTLQPNQTIGIYTSLQSEIYVFKSYTSYVTIYENSHNSFTLGLGDVIIHHDYGFPLQYTYIRPVSSTTVLDPERTEYNLSSYGYINNDTTADYNYLVMAIRIHLYDTYGTEELFGYLTTEIGNTTQLSYSTTLTLSKGNKLVKYGNVTQPSITITFTVTENVAIFGTAHNRCRIYFSPGAKYDNGFTSYGTLKGECDYGGAIQGTEVQHFTLKGLTPTEAFIYGTYRDTQAGYTENPGYYIICTGYGDGNQNTTMKASATSSYTNYIASYSGRSRHSFACIQDYCWAFRQIRYIKVTVG